MTQKPESALAELRRAVWAVPDADTEARRRIHIAARVLELQRELSVRSERRRRYGFGFAAAALLFGGILVFVFIDFAPPRPTAALAPEGMTVQLVGGHASRRDGQSLTAIGPGLVTLAEDPVLVTRAEESAEFRLASNTALSVAPSSELGLLRHEPAAGGFDERVRLHAGSVSLAVPKLGQREKLAVETRDATVEVRGTHFSVSVVERPPLASFTEVKVTEGRVLVRAGDKTELVGAGQSWRSIDALPSEPAASPVTPSPDVALPSEPTRRPSHARDVPPRRVSTPSELATQNRLLEAAELAQKGGMPALALERVELLIARFPDAELAHNARVERLRLLRGMGRTREAERAARQYLELYPRGFAREEAERLIAPPAVPER
jgi:hypothetical protein